MQNTTPTIESTLKTTKNGERYRVTYLSKEGQKSLIAKVIPYAESKQGKDAIATRGEIKPSPYERAESFGDGVLTLKSDPSKGFYFQFQKQTRNEKGQWAGDECRIMNAGNILEMSKV